MKPDTWQYRTYIKIMRSLGVKEGLYPYTPNILHRLVRIVFFFPDRLREQLYWWGIFFIDSGNKYRINTKRNRNKWGDRG